MLYGFLYRLVMRIAHYYNWHHAPPIYPDGDKQLWCKWCGFRQTVKYAIEDIKVYKNTLVVSDIENIYKDDTNKQELESAVITFLWTLGKPISALSPSEKRLYELVKHKMN